MHRFLLWTCSTHSGIGCFANAGSIELPDGMVVPYYPDTLKQRNYRSTFLRVPSYLNPSMAHRHQDQLQYWGVLLLNDQFQWSLVLTFLCLTYGKLWPFFRIPFPATRRASKGFIVFLIPKSNAAPFDYWKPAVGFCITVRWISAFTFRGSASLCM